MTPLEVNRKITSAFINQFPLTVVLTPTVKVATASGGFTEQPGTPRAPQVMTMIENSTQSGAPEPARASEGEYREAQHTLLAEWNAQMAVGDTFVLHGKSWEVVETYYENGWERRALVVRRG